VFVAMYHVIGVVVVLALGAVVTMLIEAYLAKN
jgi:hypothetical protein